MKKQALKRLKKFYGILLVLCLILTLTQIDYSDSLDAINTDMDEVSEEAEEAITTSKKGNVVDMFIDVAEDTVLDKGLNLDNIIPHFITADEKEDTSIGIVAVGYSRGAFASLVNGVSSGKYLEMAYATLKSITNANNLLIAICILLSLAFFFAIRTFVLNIFYVSVKRAALEMRIYDKFPIKRLLYVVSVRKVWNVALTILLMNIYHILWSITIIGGFIKSYSYMMVPYILAENPSITPKKAITLSRRMMDGHKWEACKFYISFLGWYILELVTFGVSAVLFSNPYKEMARAEYYEYIRSLAKEKQIPDIELLNDRYLFEKADISVLDEAYKEVPAYLEESIEPIEKHPGIRGFMEDVFGIIPFFDEREALHQQKQAKQIALHDYKAIMEQDMYPFRLFMVHHKDSVIRFSSIEYNRHYSILSLIFIFFSLSFVGWLWEVALHFITDGVFVNRGVMLGPWLPIYGCGAVLMLIILYKLRKHVLIEFIATIVLCGTIEYSTAWLLETLYHGTKWWDYTGYFLNIHGRVCAEGLLVFGLGGLAIVYLLGPFLDNHFRKIPKKIAIALAVLLLAVFIGDIAYSRIHPNEGDGITNVTQIEHGMPYIS